MLWVFALHNHNITDCRASVFDSPHMPRLGLYLHGSMGIASCSSCPRFTDWHKVPPDTCRMITLCTFCVSMSVCRYNTEGVSCQWEDPGDLSKEPLLLIHAAFWLQLSVLQWWQTVWKRNRTQLAVFSQSSSLGYNMLNTGFESGRSINRQSLVSDFWKAKVF